MLNQTKKEILEKARELNVKFIRLQFTDILGTMKNVAIPVEQLEVALEEGIMFDGSSIEGFTRVEESDMYLRPDPNTFVIFPWRTQNGETVARFICDVYTTDGNPFTGCPRYILKNVVNEAEADGYNLFIGPEPEFFLFETDEKGRPTLNTNDQGSYFDLSPMDKGADARRDIVLTLQKMGFSIETSHHEVAPGQHEIDFRFADPLQAADNLATFRFVTKAIAKRHGLHASFIPKPFLNENGSGLHFHQSLFRNGVNVFYDPEDPLKISQIARYYIGGLMQRAAAMTAIGNPTVNSYKRLVPGYEAPVDITWSAKNRTSLIRIPAVKGISTRIEYRCPDPAANPYLIIAVMIKSGLQGIKDQIQPPPQTTDSSYAISILEKQYKGIHLLPGSLKEALEYLAKDDLIKETLGEHAYQSYLKAKVIEWNVFNTQIHPWEIDQYLGTL
jgi:glutamine synthetase